MRERVSRDKVARFAGLAAAAVSFVAVNLATPTDAIAYEQRSNTVSFGFQGGMASVLRGTGEFTRGENRVPYDLYGAAGGFALHLRYSLDRSHAVGLTFEDLRFDRDQAIDPETGQTLPEQYQLNQFSFDYYLYYHRKSKLSQYLVLGAGFHRPTFRITEQESYLPGEGFSANFGGGLEYFVAKPISLDGSVRFHLNKVKGGSVWAGEAMLGFQYYLLR